MFNSCVVHIKKVKRKWKSMNIPFLLVCTLVLSVCSTDELKSAKEKFKDNLTVLARMRLAISEIAQPKTLIKEQLKVTKLKEQIKENEEELNSSCITFGTANDIQNVKILNFDTFPVLHYSAINNPGWTVIQQRINGGENFNRNWETYKKGFGNFTDDFFLGLEKIHRLTNDQPHELYVHMERFNGSTFCARYDNFRVAGEEDKYRLLSLGSYSGNADRDRLRSHEHHKFSTFDSDNDLYQDYNIAELRQSGWWYGPVSRAAWLVICLIIISIFQID